MSEDVPNGSNEKPPSRVWTLEAWTIHTTAMRDADLRLSEERDRRYLEVNIEKEKALKIKETADLAALSLARDIQTYKEAAADAATKATQDYVSGQLGAKGQAAEFRQQSNSNTGMIVAIMTAVAASLIAVIGIVVGIVIALTSGGSTP